jgi:NAD(P)-dependent dehydrogenase (short-subunit alcohol dehydrogenase family)
MLRADESRPPKVSSPQDWAQAFRLDGRRALVTGGGRGIGRCIALGLAAAGADVCVAARSVGELEAVAGEIRALGRTGEFVQADLLDPGAPGRLMDGTVGALGGIDILVNNAGASRDKTTFAEIPMTTWARNLQLLLTSQVALAQQAVRHMVAGDGRAAIINVASIYGLRGAPGGEKHLGSVTYYTAAKHGLIGVTRALAVELAGQGIRVNALCPGWVDTSMNALGDMDDEFLRRNLDQIPMRRWGTPEEMIGPAVCLAGDASSFMTGQVLVVDGGHLA